jgi:hypothetical protein
VSAPQFVPGPGAVGRRAVSAGRATRPALAASLLALRQARRPVLGPGLLAVLGLVLLAVPLRAESLWGLEGIGRPVTPYDHAARGAGSTGLAVDDPFGMSFANPAAIAHARMVQAHFGLVAQDRWIQTDTRGPDRRMDVRITMGRLVLPGPGPLRWSFGYHDLTDGSYQVRLRANAGREDEYVRTWKGTGGVGELSAGVAAGLPGGRLAAGLQVGFANGTLLEVVEDKFVSGSFLERRDILRTRVLDGRVLALGAQVAPFSGLSLGAAWRSSSSVDLRSLATSADGAGWEDRASFELPSELGLGAAVRRGRVRMAADWNRAAWGQGTFQTTAGQTSASLGSFRDTDRLGLGVTLFPPVTEAKGSVARRAVWRAGVSWGQLPVRQRPVTVGATGAGVSEWALTAGCGLPVKVDRGWLDLFVEAGRTGNLNEAGLRETFLRVGFGVTFGRLDKPF